MAKTRKNIIPAKTAAPPVETSGEMNRRLINKTEIRIKCISAVVAKRKIALDMQELHTGHGFQDLSSQSIAFAAASSPRAKVSLIEFGHRSGMDLLIMELVAVIEPKAVLLQGKTSEIQSSLKVGSIGADSAALFAAGIASKVSVRALRSDTIKQYKW